MESPSPDERVYVDFVEGKFGKLVPVVDSFVFYPKDKQRVRFVCKTRGCNETITLQEDGDGRPFATRRPRHGHPNHQYAVENLIHMQRLRAEVKDRHNRSVPTKVVVASVRRETKTSRRRSTDFRFARRTRKRGPQPRSADEIVLTPALTGNCIYINDDKSILVIAREWGIKLISCAERVCVDGTFRSAPITHHQLLTFHVLCKNGSSFPVIHVLLKDKSFATYRKVLCEIQRRADERGLGDVFGRQSLTITTDYENALIKALKRVNANTHGCYFHFCQAIWRFVHSHGFAGKYNEDSVFRDSVRSLMALPLLKESDIRRSFFKLKEILVDSALRTVYDYFERTWIDGFGVKLICQYDEMYRTNNNAEAFHSSLRQVFFSAHPNFNEFVEKMCDLMDTAETEYCAERLRPKKPNHRNLRSFNTIKNVIHNYYNDRVLRLSLPELLRRIGEILHEEACFEDLYDPGCEAVFENCLDDQYADGVPMEFDEGEEVLSS